MTASIHYAFTLLARFTVGAIYDRPQTYYHVHAEFSEVKCIFLYIVYASIMYVMHVSVHTAVERHSYYCPTAYDRRIGNRIYYYTFYLRTKSVIGNWWSFIFARNSLPNRFARISPPLPPSGPRCRAPDRRTTLWLYVLILYYLRRGLY